MDNRFNKFVNITLQSEGGYSFDKDDPGGETKFGISKRSYPGIDIKSLTIDVAKEIYYRDYYKRYGCDRINDPDVSFKLFDLCVNTGGRQAVKLIQRAVNAVSNGLNIKVDGMAGDITVNAINGCDGDKLYDALVTEASEYYKHLGNDKYLAGWLNRLNRKHNLGIA